jgi:hypothetical protein
MAERNDADRTRAAEYCAGEDSESKSSATKERRRSARFHCGGNAKISELPSDGSVIHATIRDLSLHGCCIDIPRLITCGARAEIIVCVNAASFRAIGEIKVLRAPFAIGFEFVHLSAGGKDSLDELITDLAKLKSVMKKLDHDPRESGTTSFRKQLERGQIQAVKLSRTQPARQIILPSGLGDSPKRSKRTANETRKESQECVPLERARINDVDTRIDDRSEDRIKAGDPLVITIDLFG